MATIRTLAVVSAGLSQPSSTRLLAERITASVVSRLEEQGIDVQVRSFDLREIAHDIMNTMLTGFPSPRLEEVIDAVTAADGLIAVTPIFTTSYSGLFKSFFDIIDNAALTDLPVIIAATAGTARHSLALDYAIRPMFTYLHAVVVPTAVFAASEDWGSGVDTVKTLPDRIERAAGELAPLVAASARSSRSTSATSSADALFRRCWTVGTTSSRRVHVDRRHRDRIAVHPGAGVRRRARHHCQRCGRRPALGVRVGLVLTPSSRKAPSGRVVGGSPGIRAMRHN